MRKRQSLNIYIRRCERLLESFADSYKRGKLAAYFFLTPIGALRGAVALSGHPIDAVMLQVRIASKEDVGLVKLDNSSNSTICRITKHIPYYEEPGAEVYRIITGFLFGTAIRITGDLFNRNITSCWR